MATKTLFFSTNFNNKLHSSVMVHIDKAPSPTTVITGSMMAEMIFEIQTQDTSYPPSKWQLVDLLRIPLGQLSNVITWPSHGMDYFDFYQWVKKIQVDANAETLMAIYYYKKLGA